MIKPKNWFLNLWIPGNRWFTMAPNIYAGDAYFADPGNIEWVPLRAHEEVHLTQQGSHFLFWFLHYETSAAFKVSQEVEGIARELQVASDTTHDVDNRFKNYCSELSGSSYGNAEPCPSKAAADIVAACQRIGFNYAFLEVTP